MTNEKQMTTKLQAEAARQDGAWAQAREILSKGTDAGWAVYWFCQNTGPDFSASLQHNGKRHNPDFKWTPLPSEGLVEGSMELPLGHTSMKVTVEWPLGTLDFGAPMPPAEGIRKLEEEVRERYEGQKTWMLSLGETLKDKEFRASVCDALLEILSDKS